MKAFIIILSVWLSVSGFALLILHIKSHRFVKSVILNAFLAFIAIAIINITKKFTGVYIPINMYTVNGCGILGLPCVCGVVLLQMLV